MKLNPSLRNKLIAASIISWLIACAIPALRFHPSGDHPVIGLELLLNGLFWGWASLNFAAFANPFLWAGWIQCLRGEMSWARMLSVISLTFACQTIQLIIHPCTWPSPGDNYPWSDSPKDCGYWAKPELGLGLWLASMLLLFVASFAGQDHEEPAKKTPSNSSKLARLALLGPLREFNQESKTFTVI